MSKKTNKKYVISALVAVVMLMLLVFVINSRQKPVTSLKTPLPEPSLKELADAHGLKLGNHAIYIKINEPAYNQILTEQHHFTTLDNTPNWHFNGYDLRPSIDKYDYWQLDYLVDYSEKNNMPMQAHHLLWGEKKWLPDWLVNGNYSKDQLNQIIDDHIANVAGRYKGRIAEWTVVNEAFTRSLHLYNLDDWWADATGSWDYIDRAFIDARKADPNAKLILNDFNNETKNNVSDLMYDYVKSAKTRGVPIDGLGMQMHIDGSNPPKKQDVIDNMHRFAELGLDIYVTEFDVNMADLKKSYAEKAEVEKQVYYDMVRACIESKVCHSFAMLGITDQETWYNYVGLKEPMPLMFDRNYEPKPAYYGIRQALSEK